MPLKSSLQISFGAKQKALADLYRQLIPITTLGTGPAAIEARAVMQRAADQASTALKDDAATWIRDGGIAKPFRIGVNRANQSVGVSFGGVNQPLLERLTLEASRDLIKASDGTRPFLRQALTRAQAVVTRAGVQPVLLEQSLNSTLAQGVLERESVPQLRRRILASTGLEKGDRVLLINGKTWDAEAYAEMVARTRPAQAMNLAKADDLQRRGYKFIETSFHAGVKDDDICAELQGRVWALEENEEGIPVLPPEYGLPPWHPNCLHTFGVWIPEFQGGEKGVEKVIDDHSDDSETIGAFMGKTSRPSET